VIATVKSEHQTITNKTLTRKLMLPLHLRIINSDALELWAPVSKSKLKQAWVGLNEDSNQRELVIHYCRALGLNQALILIAKGKLDKVSVVLLVKLLDSIEMTLT